MDQQTLLILAAIAVVGVLLFIFSVRDVGKRRFRPKAHFEELTTSLDVLKTSCDCQTNAEPGCIPATQCDNGTPGPVAIRGISCDPDDARYIFAGDVQDFVDASNAMREQERKANASERLLAVAKHLNANNSKGK